jgi:Right handed beta helix region
MTRVLLLLLFVFPALAQDVTLELAPIEHPPTAKVLVVSAKVTNQTDRDLRDVTVLAELQPGPVLAGQSDDVWSCRDNGTLKSVRCTAAVLPAKTTVPLTLYIDALHGRFHVQLQWEHVVTSVDGWFPHDIHVTHDGDSGRGSLREAMRLANEDCEGLKLPCRIVFDEAMTIRPQSPLPAIWNHDIAIDGGGRVVLDGSEVSGGSGLELVGNGVLNVVRRLTVRAFPWDGIHVDKENHREVLVEECTIEANGSRGVTAELHSGLTVRRSTIRHNGRSGVFLLNANPVVEENVIEANGASGVFADRYNVRIARNRITGNAHFGVAVSRGVGTVEITENSISGNGVLNIDRGLDGSDGDRYDDYATFAAYIPPPKIAEARFDAESNTTTIRGTYFDARDHWGTWSLELFAGDAFLGRTQAQNGAFTFVVEGDFRGRPITATGFRRLFLGLSGDWWWTSEYSAPVPVE